jgi:hypothetical protein
MLYLVKDCTFPNKKTMENDRGPVSRTFEINNVLHQLSPPNLNMIDCPPNLKEFLGQSMKKTTIPVPAVTHIGLLQCKSLTVGLRYEPRTPMGFQTMEYI